MRLVLMLAALLPAVAYAADPMTPWLACTNDADCVAIQGVCNPAAVNALYVQQAQAHFKERAQTTKCTKQFWQPKLDAAGAKCWQRSCQIVGKSK